MQPGVVETIQAWLLAVLLYPGLLFGVLVALAGEWLYGALRSMLAPRLYRSQAHPAHLLQPARDFLKLAGRRSPAPLLPSGSPPASIPSFEVVASFACALAPLLALVLLPLPGSPLAGDNFQGSDLFVVVALLAVQPVLRALIGFIIRDDPVAEQRLSQMRQAYEPYVNALSRYLLMPLPPWFPVAGIPDDWQLGE